MCGSLQVLGVPSSSSDVDVVTELRSRLEAAGLVATSSSMTEQDGESIAAAVAAEAARHEATISELKTSNESLRAKLKSVYKSSHDAKLRHSKDVAKLQKTVAELQQRVRDKQTTAEVRGKSGVQSSAGAVDNSAEVGARSADSRAGGGGIVLQPVSDTSSHSRPPHVTSTADRDHNSTAAAAGVHWSPTSPVAMPPLALHKTLPTTTTGRAVPPTTAVVLPSLVPTDTAAYTDEHTATSLRSQVRCRFFCNNIQD